MTTYADEIEEANDNAVRRAHVNAMFESTKMAARLAPDRSGPSHAATTEVGAVISLAAS
jgi:hypothetical protein